MTTRNWARVKRTVLVGTLTQKTFDEAKRCKSCNYHAERLYTFEPDLKGGLCANCILSKVIFGV